MTLKFLALTALVALAAAAPQASIPSKPEEVQSAGVDKSSKFTYSVSGNDAVSVEAPAGAEAQKTSALKEKSEDSPAPSAKPGELQGLVPIVPPGFDPYYNPYFYKPGVNAYTADPYGYNVPFGFPGSYNAPQIPNFPFGY